MIIGSRYYARELSEAMFPPPVKPTVISAAITGILEDSPIEVLKRALKEIPGCPMQAWWAQDAQDHLAVVFEVTFPTIDVGYRFRTPGAEKFRLTHNSIGPFNIRGACIELGIQPSSPGQAVQSALPSTDHNTNQLITELKAATLSEPTTPKAVQVKTLTAFYSFVAKAKELAVASPTLCTHPDCLEICAKAPAGSQCSLCQQTLCSTHETTPHPHGLAHCSFTLCLTVVDKSTFSECTRCRKLSCPKHTKTAGKRCPSSLGIMLDSAKPPFTTGPTVPFPRSRYAQGIVTLPPTDYSALFTRTPYARTI